MFNLIAFTIAIHGLSAAIWVGGMFFAYICLRPSLGPLEPPQRLQLWGQVFRRFFAWVWIIAAALPLTGNFLIVSVYGGFANAGINVHIMNGIGWIMIVLFAVLYFIPYRRFNAAVGDQDWPLAAKNLNSIRRIVAINLALGLIVIAIATSGRYWG